MADSDSGSSMMVALVAIVVIIALGFIVLQVIPGNNTGGNGQINVDLPSATGGTGGQ